jgi:hypothetical protein
MKLKFSLFDRVVAGIALRSVPWDGGEEGVLARYKLTQVLEVQSALEAAKEKPFDQLSRAAGFLVDLTADQVELLAFTVGGGPGSGLQGAIGAVAGEFLTRLRAQAPKPKKIDETKGKAA